MAKGLHTALGLTWYSNVLYVGSISSPSNGIVTALSGFNGHAFAHRKRVLKKLPIGRHTVDTIVPGPGGRLYVGVGSTFDNKGRAGRVLSFMPRRQKRAPRGDRPAQPVRARVHPAHEHAADHRQRPRRPRRVQAARRARRDRRLRAGQATSASRTATTRAGPSCRGTVPPLVRFGAHASSDGIAVTSNGKTAYVAENGSSFAANPTGSDVQKITLSGKGARLRAHRTLLSKAFAVARPAGRRDRARRHAVRHALHQRWRRRGPDALKAVLPSVPVSADDRIDVVGSVGELDCVVVVALRDFLHRSGAVRAVAAVDHAHAVVDCPRFAPVEVERDGRDRRRAARRWSSTRSRPSCRPSSSRRRSRSTRRTARSPRRWAASSHSAPRCARWPDRCRRARSSSRRLRRRRPTRCSACPRARASR